MLFVGLLRLSYCFYSSQSSIHEDNLLVIKSRWKHEIVPHQPSFVDPRLGYNTCATAIAVYIGNSNKGPTKNYWVQGNFANQIFGAFNALAIIVCIIVFGNARSWMMTTFQGMNFIADDLNEFHVPSDEFLVEILTIVLCLGIRESLALISIMATTKVIIVIFVIIVGFFKIVVSNWSPFVTNGFKAVANGVVVFFCTRWIGCNGNFN
ncbi:hypothetical protein NE237_032127 [Protea cynaroides]|uniref:Uncharacterized protein n=1 Tax=Protea cynaroides TaxID=273540 RepID=A0A9Q0L2U2_9MAGN|nr:hypothetical protein NE237_032127 [Protea cynaroides]